MCPLYCVGGLFDPQCSLSLGWHKGHPPSLCAAFSGCGISPQEQETIPVLRIYTMRQNNINRSSQKKASVPRTKDTYIPSFISLFMTSSHLPLSLAFSYCPPDNALLPPTSANITGEQYALVWHQRGFPHHFALSCKKHVKICNQPLPFKGAHLYPYLCVLHSLSCIRSHKNICYTILVLTYFLTHGESSALLSPSPKP